MPGLARSTGHLPARLCPPCPTLRPFPPRPPPTLGTEPPRFSSKASAQRRPETAGNGAAGPQPSWEPETRGRRGSFLLPRAAGARRERRAAPVSQPRRGGPEIPLSAAPVPSGGGRTDRGGVPGYSQRRGTSSAAPRGKSPRQADGRRREAGTSRLPPPAIPHLSRAAAGPGRREVALGVTHLKSKSLPFGLKVTKRVGNTCPSPAPIRDGNPGTPEGPHACSQHPLTHPPGGAGRAARAVPCRVLPASLSADIL